MLQEKRFTLVRVECIDRALQLVSSRSGRPPATLADAIALSSTRNIRCWRCRRTATVDID
jgi:hypothetical protein